MPSSKKHNRGVASRSGVAFVLQKLREMKLTRKEFAERAGIGLRSLQHYLENKKVDLDTIRRIAQALGLDEMDLIDPYGTIDFLALMNALANQGIETLEVDQVVELAMAQLTPSREPQPEEDQMNLNDSERFLYFESLIHYWLQNP